MSSLSTWVVGGTYRLAAPRLQCFPVRTQVCVHNLWHDVLPEFALKALHGKRGIHSLHESLHLRALILLEPAADCRRHAPKRRDDRVLALVVLLLQRCKRPEDRVRLLELVPPLLSRRILVQHERLASPVIIR